jgi:hypothetical protein
MLWRNKLERLSALSLSVITQYALAVMLRSNNIIALVALAHFDVV